MFGGWEGARRNFRNSSAPVCFSALKFADQPTSYAVLLMLPLFVFCLCTCTHLVRDLFLVVHHLSEVSIAKLDHQTHSHFSNHLSNLSSSGYPFDSVVHVCLCVYVFLCVSIAELDHQTHTSFKSSFKSQLFNFKLSFRLHVCLCVYVFLCVCMYYMCVFLYMHLYVCVCACVCVFLHVCVCVCVHVNVCVCVSGLFGEGPAERRGRLRQLLAVLGEDAVKQKKTHMVEQMKTKDEVCFDW